MGDAATDALKVATIGGEIASGNWVSAALDAAALLGGGLWANAANYHKMDAIAIQIVNQYGADFITGSQAAGVTSTDVAAALSDYLKEQNVTLTPQQLLTDAAKNTNALAGISSPGAAQNYLPYAALAAGVFVLFMVMKK